MAEITLLTPEQIVEREQKPTGKGRSGRGRSPERTRVIEEFKAAMQDVQPGYGADVFLTEDEVKRIVRQNLKTAAAEQQLGVEFRPVKNPSRIHLRFISLEEQAARPKRPGGRPRKVDQALAERAEVNGEAEGADEQTEAQPEAEQAQPTPPKRRRTRKATAPTSDGG